MELSVSGRMKRAAQAGRTVSASEKKAPAVRGTVFKRSFDKQEWSQTALSFLQELNRQDLEKQRKLLEAKRKGSGELDALTRSLKTMDKCREIAARIIQGDKVPPEDERYLMDHDPDGYKLALACRQPKEKPKEWESVLDDEDRQGGGETTAPVESGGETAEA